jgi:hypothetical protein
MFLSIEHIDCRLFSCYFIFKYENVKTNEFVNNNLSSLDFFFQIKDEVDSLLYIYML